MESNEPKEIIDNYNLYGKYFSGTEKLWKHESKKLIKEIIENDKEIGRKFLRGSSVSYIEIFEDKKLNVLGLTKRISLLLIPDKEINSKNCIGFRYYENNNKDKCNYFTLIKKNTKGYFILEKSTEINDSDNEMFYNKDLDCYSIMKNIVYEKYEGNDISKKSPNGELFPEIIGYTYSMINLGKFKNFTILEPFIPNRLEKETLKEDEKTKKLEEGLGFIEPIFYDNHVSVLLIVKDEKYYRKNYLFDMSKHHSNKNIYDITLFPKDMISDLFIYPNKSIQKNNSCGLWYYGILELLYSSNKYNNAKDILNKIEDNQSDFYFDIINLLSEKLYNLPKMIDFQSIDEKENFDLKRIYDTVEGEDISFSQQCIKNYYFSLSEKYGWTEKNINYANGMEPLFNYEILFEKIMNYKREIELNEKYLKEFTDIEYYNSRIKNKIELQLDRVKKTFNVVNMNFIKEFNNMICDNMNEFIFVNEDKNYDDLKKRINLLGKKTTKDILYLTDQFLKVKKNLKSIHLLDESTIINNLNPNHDMLFQLMNK